MLTNASRGSRLACVVAVLVGTACGDPHPPAVEFGDAGRPPPGAPTPQLASPVGEVGVFGSGLYPAAPLPPPEWTSPDECPQSTDGGHCPSCWSWVDAGPRSLGRASVDDHFGRSVAVADFNGDGYPDLATGAPQEDASPNVDTGLVYVFLGTARGFQPWVVLEDAAGGGPYNDSQFGRYLHAADITGDERAELFVGYGRWLTDTPIQIFSGADDGLNHHATFRLSDLDPGMSTQNSSSLGSTWATADFDHDGDIDVAVGAPRFTGGGRVYVLANDGTGGLTLGYELVGGDRFGTALAATAADELVVGSSLAGEVLVYDSGTLVADYTTSLGMVSFGTSLATGDLDGDAIDEILVGGWKESFLEVAGTSNSISTGSALAPYLVWPLGVGDLDDDGYADVILVHEVDFSANYYDNVLQFVEGDGTRSPVNSFEITGGMAEEAEDVLGDSGAIADIDGDGRLDLVAGAHGNANLASGGRVYAYAPPVGADWKVGIEPSQMVHQETALASSCDECTVYDHADGVLCGNDGGDDEICVSRQCVNRDCGDGYRQPVVDGLWPRESCDDGNTLSGDACSASCVSQLLVVASDDLTADSPSRLPPSAAGDGRDHVLFAYMHDAGETRQLLARTYSAAGVPEQELAAPLVVATLPGVGWDAQASVAGLASGGWVVAWTDPDLDGGASGIAYRIVAADGSLGPVYTANEDARGEQLEPRVAPLSTGFIVVWTDAGGFDGPLGRSLIEARRFTESGAPLEDEWPVSDPEATSTQPALASWGDDFVVIWTETPDAEYGPPALLARRFGAVEDAVPFALATNASEASVAALDTGEYAAAWTSRVGDYRGNILTRVIDPVSADPLAPSVEQTVAADGTYSEMAPSVAPLAGVEYAVAYETRGHRRGLAWVHVGMSTLPPETSTLTPYLSGDLEGDVTLLRTSRGLWFAWSDAGDTTPDAYRSFLAFLLPVD